MEYVTTATRGRYKVGNCIVLSISLFWDCVISNMQDDFWSVNNKKSFFKNINKEKKMRYIV